MRRDTVRTAAIVYRRLAAPLALPKVRRLLRDGLPEPFAAPIRYLFSGRLTAEDRAVVARVEGLRHAFLHQHSSVVVSASRNSEDQRTYSSQWIAEVSSIPPDWGTCLYLLAKNARARTILELGSCAGFSGCYLASAGSCERLITVEGSPGLAEIADGHLRQVTTRATVVNAFFDDALDDLPGMAPIDLVFIDGDHTHDGRHRYFGRVQPYLSRGALVVFDDLHLSEDMWQTWHELRQLPGVSWAINFGRIGACVWDPDHSAPARYLDLSPFTAWMRIGNRWKTTAELRAKRTHEGLKT